jgi:hypothetical protein
MIELTFAACADRGLQRSNHVACGAGSMLDWQDGPVAALVCAAAEHPPCLYEK